MGRHKVVFRMHCKVGMVTLLAKNEVMLVVVLGVLLYANSTRGRRPDQLSCW